MRISGWLRAAAAPLLALAAVHFADAADAPAPPPGASAAPPAASAGSEPAGTSSWPTEALAPLRELGVESWRDVIKFAPWTGDVSLDFDAQEQRIRAPGSPDQRFGTLLYGESVGIRNDGFAVIHPGLMIGSMGLRLSLQQQQNRTTDGKMSQNGTVVNYAFDATVLPESPYNVGLSVNRNETTYVLPSGGTTRSNVRNQSITFLLRENSILRDREILPYFSGSLRAAQQYNRQATNVGGQAFTQDDRRDLVALDARNGTETSDSSVQYQFARLANHAYRQGSYESQSLNVGHNVDFGPTLNWRLDSRVNYYTRSGEDFAADLSNLDVNEFLTVDHNVDLFSSYSYLLSRQDSAFGAATTQSGRVQVSQILFRNLTVDASVNGLSSTLPGGKIVSTGGQLGMSYTRALPREGRLTAAAGGSYLITDSQVPAGAVQVVDAPYRVPQAVGAGSSILLRDRNIEAPTIVVIVLKGETRVPAVLEIDYTLTIDGDRTSLVPLATSAVMLPGDPLNVGYTYQVAPDARYATTSRTASVVAEWPWFGLSLGHDESGQKPLSGSETTLLLDERRDTGTAYVRGIWDASQARAGAAMVRYESGRLAYDEKRLDQLLTYQPSDNLRINLAASQYQTDYRRPEHTAKGSSVRLDASWLSGAWVTTGYAAWRSYRDTRQQAETIKEAGLRVRRTWLKLDFAAALGVQQRTRGGVESTNAIIHLNAIRRF